MVWIYCIRKKKKKKENVCERSHDSQIMENMAHLRSITDKKRLMILDE